VEGDRKAEAKMLHLGGAKVSRQTLLCLLCIFLSISVITTLWAVVPPFKPALAQPDDEGAGYAEAQLGPGKRVLLPAIDNENGWETWVQVQNVGTTDSGVVVFFWGDYSEKCPANDPGPIDTACMRVVKNAVWTLQAHIPTQAKSAIAYSVTTTVFGEACENAGDAVGDTNAWRAWEDTYEGTGEPLAVIVQRKGPNDFDTVVSSAYPGLTESMQGEGPPYQYFTPYAMRRYHNLYTVMVIQNSGDQCTPISIYYKEQAPCIFEWIQRVEQLAPGESVRLRVPDGINCEWLGSAYVQANEPLSIIVDQTSFFRYCVDSNDRGTLLTYWAQPYKPAGDTLAYANLMFRMSSGWQTGIQVQNLTQESLPTFVTVNFLDNSGGELIFLGDWICPNGASTFFLPAITDLGFDYVGAADIQSHKQVDYPSGKETGGQPIFAVVDVKKTLVYSDTFDDWITALPGEAQGGAYNADPLSAHRGWRYIALPSISKLDEAISTIAIRNNSNCNRIQLRINIHDATGAKQTIFSSLWLEPKQLRLVDLANIGTVASGFIGAGTVEVISEQQLCDTDGDGDVDPELVMPSAIVFNKGHPSGDITTVYDGIPYAYAYSPCNITISGHVIDQFTLDPINDASISINGAEYATTDPTGYYSFEYFKTVEPITITMMASAADYVTGTVTLEDIVCDDQVVNFELVPECTDVTIEGTVEDKMTGEYIEGATVQAFRNGEPVSDPVPTDEFGTYTLVIPFDPDKATVVTASAADYRPAADTVYIPECGGSAVISFQLHQTPKAKALLYYGNGGIGGPTDVISYTHLAARLEDLGKTVVYTDVWPTQFDWTLKYELIVLLGPGHDTFSVTAPYTEDLIVDGFTIGQKADLDFFLQQDGKLVILSDATSFTGVDVENDLLNALPVSLLFDLADYSSGHGDQITADQCWVAQMQTYSALGAADNWTSIQATVLGAVPGDMILQNAGSTFGPNEEMYGVDVPSHGNGWVAILGDMHGLSDAAWMSNWNWSGDNEWVPFNWLACPP
jgi:hypothetical protein